MSHSNISDKTKGQGSLNLQFFPQQSMDEDKLELIFYNPSSETDVKKPKHSFQPILFSLKFQKIKPAPENKCL